MDLGFYAYAHVCMYTYTHIYLFWKCLYYFANCSGRETLEVTPNISHFLAFMPFIMSSSVTHGLWQIGCHSNDYITFYKTLSC